MENNPQTSQKTPESKKSVFFAMASNLLLSLPERSQEIVRKRFGLYNGDKQTLERIGKDFGITRERVRQIITEAIKKISKNSSAENFQKAEEKILSTISENDGIISEEKILSVLGSEEAQETNAVGFFSACIKKIAVADGKGSLKKSWSLSKDATEKAKEVAVVAKEILTKEQNLLTEAEIVGKIAKTLGEKKIVLNSKQIANHLEVAAEVQKNKFGKWGMRNWKEVNPKGTREKVYLVLKEKNKPLHFTEIAKLIDEYKLGRRKAHPQTVHNELIKDERFVLIGRGIYALKEWGYSEGTVKDVLENILRESGKALSKDEILEKVAKVRKVKKATILINLNNSKEFVRQNNFYTLKK